MSQYGFKRDDNKQRWEDTEFPLVCETCMGDNPYVRMTQEKYGKKCQICENPFTVFAWQAGTKGRLKKVEICKCCAQAKNVCQVCIYDLQYGLPVKVRDRVLLEDGSACATVNVPQSMANRAWYTAQQERALAQSQNTVGEANALSVARLEEIANMKPRYERNMAKLCSFFAKGECNRGVNCPFRHELPRDRNEPMSKQNTKDRFYGTSDPVANKILEQQKKREERAKRAGCYGDTSRTKLYLRFNGEAPFPVLTESDIRDQFYAFGEIVSVRIQAEKGQAFVEYTEPDATELAISSMNRKSLLQRQIIVSWARLPKRGDAKTTKHGSASEVMTALAPPGEASYPSSVPKIFSMMKPPAHIAAIAASRRKISAVGGGPVRGMGSSIAKISTETKKLYYPSSDPGRFGTHKL